VAPDHEIIYPRITFNNDKKDNELTNGHSHFLLIGDAPEDDSQKLDSDHKSQSKGMNKIHRKYFWGDETAIKFDLAKRIAAGRMKK